MIRAAIRGNGQAKLKEALRTRQSFNTYGALEGRTRKEDECRSVGELNADERARHYADLKDMSYVVYSYDTPIAWVLKNGTVHKVNQKFSRTTSRHQGKLYLMDV